LIVLVPNKCGGRQRIFIFFRLEDPTPLRFRTGASDPMQTTHKTPRQAVAGPSAAVPNGTSTGPNTAGASAGAVPQDFLGTKSSGTPRSHGYCACGNSWCSLSLGDKMGHRVPSGNQVTIGRRWINRLQLNRIIARPIEASLENPKSQVRIHRSHFYPAHLYQHKGGRILIRNPSTFNTDPKSRSWQEIRDDVQAPRSDTAAEH
jgi:hypothetical protein